MSMRAGNGFDAHRFKAGSKLILGGVEIPYHMGLEAHSDGDVVLHALCDAILGALARGDIGQHFPDTSNEFMVEDNYQIMNLDLTIIAQAPKLAPYITAMRENIAADLLLDLSQVSIKATTTEKMGFTGREEGVAVLSSVLLALKTS